MDEDEFIDDDDDEAGALWEDEAYEAVTSILEDISQDDLRGSVGVRDTIEDRYSECFTLEELREHLEVAYDQAWYAHVPFDGGEAVFEADAQGIVGDILAATDIEEFFEAIREPESVQRLFRSRELVADLGKSAQLQFEICDVGKELVEYFARHPEKLREVDPREFEKIMAAVFQNRGFDVTLSKATRDGGFDLMLMKHDVIGAIMTLVQCKRYGERNKVGVEVVRGLYGVVEEKRATNGLIVTTSVFTPDALRTRERMRHRMQLADLDEIQRWLKEWR